MLHIITDPSDSLLDRINEDPVRPHIPALDRIGPNRDIFVSLDGDRVRAITCVSYNPEVPASEQELFSHEIPMVAVFYTIWSYASGAARDLLMSAVDYIQEHRQDISQFVTLSPKTEMAHRFHITNGARVLRENSDTINYEYCR